MSEAKAEILRRIREATADGPVADPVQRTYRRTSSRDPVSYTHLTLPTNREV